MHSVCARAFLSAIDEPAADPEAIAAHVDSVLAQGRTAWPTVAIDHAAFGAWLATRFGVRAPLVERRAADLYLAFACGLGDGRAIRAFEQHYFDDIRGVLRTPTLMALHDEVAQLLRIKLFSKEGSGEPLIALYSGRGDLRVWFRVVALRTALNVRRSTKSEVELPERIEQSLAFATGDPELAHLREHYRSDFDGAFRMAVAELAPSERNLLCLRYVERITIHQIAALHGVHRATIARRIDGARETVLARTRSLLGQRLGLTESEIESLLRLLTSVMDVDLAEILAPE